MPRRSARARRPALSLHGSVGRRDVVRHCGTQRPQRRRALPRRVRHEFPGHGLAARRRARGTWLAIGNDSCRGSRHRVRDRVVASALDAKQRRLRCGTSLDRRGSLRVLSASAGVEPLSAGRVGAAARAARVLPPPATDRAPAGHGQARSTDGELGTRRRRLLGRSGLDQTVGARACARVLVGGILARTPRAGDSCAEAHRRRNRSVCWRPACGRGGGGLAMVQRCVAVFSRHHAELERRVCRSGLHVAGPSIDDEGLAEVDVPMEPARAAGGGGGDPSAVARSEDTVPHSIGPSSRGGLALAERVLPGLVPSGGLPTAANSALRDGCVGLARNRRPHGRLLGGPAGEGGWLARWDPDGPRHFSASSSRRTAAHRVVLLFEWRQHSRDPRSAVALSRANGGGAGRMDRSVPCGGVLAAAAREQRRAHLLFRGDAAALSGARSATHGSVRSARDGTVVVPCPSGRGRARAPRTLGNVRGYRSDFDRRVPRGGSEGDPGAACPQLSVESTGRISRGPVCAARGGGACSYRSGSARKSFMENPG